MNVYEKYIVFWEKFKKIAEKNDTYFYIVPPRYKIDTWFLGIVKDRYMSSFLYSFLYYNKIIINIITGHEYTPIL